MTQEVPGTSAQHLSQRTGHTRETVRRALRAKGMHPYDDSTLQEWQPSDFKNLVTSVHGLQTNLTTT